MTTRSLEGAKLLWRPTDTGRGDVHLRAGPVLDHRAISRAIDGMFRGGGTDILAGLQAGVAQLAGSFRDRGVSVSALGLDFDQDKLMAIADQQSTSAASYQLQRPLLRCGGRAGGAGVYPGGSATRRGVRCCPPDEPALP